MKLVVNFDLPYEHRGGDGPRGGGPRAPDFATFQHRSGRVGRFGQVGAVLHLVTNADDMDALNGCMTHFALVAHALPDASPDEASVMVEEAMAKPRGAAAAAEGGIAPPAPSET